MCRHPNQSLKTLIRRYQVAVLLILMTVAGVGALWASFWQNGYQSALRLNGLLVEAQTVRGDLYRQIKTIDQVHDRKSRDDYWQRLYRIDDHFFNMRSYARSTDEQGAIARMETAYGLILAAMNRVVTRPGSSAARAIAVDPDTVDDFERAYNRLSDEVAIERERLTHRLGRWNRLAPWLAWLPLLLGVILVLWLNRRFARGFLGPLQRLTEGTGELAQGNLSYRLEERGVSELQRLARTMNEMATKLVSQRRALVERERQAALGALVPVIAHNIRNPLAGIRANAQTLDMEQAASERVMTRADIIAATDRLERWLDSLLSFLHPLDLTRRAHKLDAVIDGAVAALGSRLAAADVILDRQRCNITLKIDAPLLEQALHGLLANALEASPRGAHLHVACDCGDEQAMITIDDAGPGMPIVPDPQANAPLPTTKRRGTGLGIPFAYKVIGAHEGTLDYTTAPGGGTRVRIRLPRHNS